MTLESLNRRKRALIAVHPASFTPDPFPIEPDPDAVQTPEEPNDVVGDEGGGGTYPPSEPWEKAR